MAVDEALLIGAARGDWTLRLYRWLRPTLSIGYAQRYRDIPDPAGLRRRGVAVVRRPTGGRAVLHADELTYALAAPHEGPLGGGVSDSYRRIASGLLRGLAYLGAEVDVQRTRRAQDVGADRSKTAACFGVRARYEIVAAGRKLIGSAQCRRRGCVLQHGSILMGASDPRRWRAIGSGGESAAAASIGLVEVLGQRPSPRRVAACVARGCAEELGLARRDDRLTRRERRIAAGLEARYRDPGWTRRR